MIAPLRFGQPTIEFAGGEVAMEVSMYDLDAVEYKEKEKIEDKREEGFPLHLILLALLGLVIILFIFFRKRGTIPQFRT
jgi:hypothetical protein